MSILSKPASKVNSKAPRTFAEGLEPASVAALPAITSGDWRTDVRGCLLGMGYHVKDVARILTAMKANGGVTPHDVDAQDVAMLNGLFERHCPPAGAVAAEIAASVDPAFMAFEPTAADRLWWFQQCAAADRAALNPNGIRKPFRHWRGQKTKGSGRFTDRDAARRGAV
jgi:hypothetical protein